MILKRTASFVPMGLSRPQPRRGAFALEPIDALPRLAERIRGLAERALEPNPFFLPEFLEPAIRAFGAKGVKLATFSDRNDLRFFAPVVTTGGGILSGPRLSVWTHPYAPLGTPLIDRDVAPQVADSLLKHLRMSGRTLLSLPDLPLDGPVSQCLKEAAERRGFWTEAGRQDRPILYADERPGSEVFDRMVTPKRRRELDRQLRRLCETGSVSFMSARTPAEAELAFNIFVALEVSGWKGRRGTALRRQRAIHEFSHAAVARLAQKGQATIDVMRVGDKPVAALIWFQHGDLSVPWKIAYDEAFAAFSPGRQLMCDETRRWLLDPSITRVDPVCEEGNSLFAGIWRDREPYGTLLVTPRRWGIAARLRAGFVNIGGFTRRQARTLLRGPRRRVRSAGAAKATRSRRPAPHRADV